MCDHLVARVRPPRGILPDGQAEMPGYGGLGHQAAVVEGRQLSQKRTINTIRRRR